MSGTEFDHETPQPMIDLLVADDHSLVRNGLCRLINNEADMAVKSEAADGASVLSLIASNDYSLLLLDLSMPSPSGPALIEAIREIKPELPILVVTMQDNPAMAKLSMESGANGYITKDSEPDILLRAIRQVAAGKNYLSPDILKSVGSLGLGRKPSPALSKREKEILAQIAAGLSNNEIARVLFISEKTVSTHKSNIMEKLQLKTFADLLRYADLHQSK
ncbi:MAG: response regulator transcription factor [Porticoccaceae bacterium]